MHKSTHPFMGTLIFRLRGKTRFSTSGFFLGSQILIFSAPGGRWGNFHVFFLRGWTGTDKKNCLPRWGGTIYQWHLSMALWTCICFYITLCRISRANHFVSSKREIWCQVGIMTYNTFTNTCINIYTGYSMDACRGYLKKWRVFFLFRFKMSSSHFILCFWHLYMFGFVMRCSDNVWRFFWLNDRETGSSQKLIGSYWIDDMDSIGFP